MKETTTEKLMQYLQKNQNKMIHLSDFKRDLTELFKEPLTEGRIYKITHQLKNRGYLISLKKDILFIKDPQKEIEEEVIEEHLYRKILKQHCQQYC